jgi:hypothetical protein
LKLKIQMSGTDQSVLVSKDWLTLFKKWEYLLKTRKHKMLITKFLKLFIMQLWKLQSSLQSNRDLMKLSKDRLCRKVNFNLTSGTKGLTAIDMIGNNLDGK